MLHMEETQMSLNLKNKKSINFVIHYQIKISVVF